MTLKNLLKMTRYLNGTSDIVIKAHTKSAVHKAADRLKHGQVIALPTDTVYGLACSANCPNAIQKLYEIKGREENKPVAICKYTCTSHIYDKHSQAV